MSWIVDSSLSRIQKFCVNVVKCGPVPNHIAIIMDGNRRFAQRRNMEKVVGHTMGFDKLAQTLQWCRELGITEVTVYAFSIENFKRSPKEVEQLMQLAREKYQKLLDERDKLMENGVCIRVIGNMSLIPPDLRAMMLEAVKLTRDNKKAFLNVAFAYTSRDEITASIKTVVEGIQIHKIAREDVDETLISRCMYSSASPEPDMIIRTSGEMRFSDFLLWQLWNTNVLFTEVLWPDFSIWHLLASVVQYQRCFNALRATSVIRDSMSKSKCTNSNSEFLSNINTQTNALNYDKSRGS